ncbi:hypothetical protein BKA70DRAFT_1412836 [Coprinopsis sp. MPI-PUGE-AT-0042]|nr:hypothetical protein BKA70DRAFT_1412836 [Coprinopsis sp. MPI-PUGE-AT-0042]
MAMTTALEEAGITEADVQLRVINLLAVWLEALLYGVYLCLFIAASPMLVRRSTLKIFSSAVFVMGNILMFVLISIHTATSICLPIFAFAYQTDSQGTSRMLSDKHHWAIFISPILGAMIFVTGDVLVIYRCFIIWQRRYLIILVPCLLLALAVGTTVANVVFVQTAPVSSVHPRNWSIIFIPFICYLLQNALTTSLIAYKIYSHLRRTRGVGLVSVHTPKLLPIVKIFVESAVVYTVGVLVLAVLVALNHPAWRAVHSCLMAIIGIVFVLMALRIHAVREESKHLPASPSLLPSWLVDDKTHLTDFSNPEPVEKEEEDQPPAQVQPRPLGHPRDGPRSTSQHRRRTDDGFFSACHALTRKRGFFLVLVLNVVLGTQLYMYWGDSSSAKRTLTRPQAEKEINGGGIEMDHLNGRGLGGGHGSPNTAKGTSTGTEVNANIGGIRAPQPSYSSAGLAAPTPVSAAKRASPVSELGRGVAGTPPPRHGTPTGRKWSRKVD